MRATFISNGLWPRIKALTPKAAHRSDVAVAYFAKGASELLPLQSEVGLLST
jgi:hypothetical protein